MVYNRQVVHPVCVKMVPHYATQAVPHVNGLSILIPANIKIEKKFEKITACAVPV